MPIDTPRSVAIAPWAAAARSAALKIRFMEDMRGVPVRSCTSGKDRPETCKAIPATAPTVEAQERQGSKKL
jgi:hypothetical protein